MKIYDDKKITKRTRFFESPLCLNPNYHLQAKCNYDGDMIIIDTDCTYDKVLISFLNVNNTQSIFKVVKDCVNKGIIRPYREKEGIIREYDAFKDSGVYLGKKLLKKYYQKESAVFLESSWLGISLYVAQVLEYCLDNDKKLHCSLNDIFNYHFNPYIITDEDKVILDKFKVTNKYNEIIASDRTRKYYTYLRIFLTLKVLDFEMLRKIYELLFNYKLSIDNNINNRIIEDEFKNVKRLKKFESPVKVDYISDLQNIKKESQEIINDFIDVLKLPEDAIFDGTMITFKRQEDTVCIRLENPNKCNEHYFWYTMRFLNMPKLMDRFFNQYMNKFLNNNKDIQKWLEEKENDSEFGEKLKIYFNSLDKVVNFKREYKEIIKQLTTFVCNDASNEVSPIVMVKNKQSNFYFKFKKMGNKVYLMAHQNGELIGDEEVLKDYDVYNEPTDYKFNKVHRFLHKSDGYVDSTSYMQSKTYRDEAKRRRGYTRIYMLIDYIFRYKSIVRFGYGDYELQNKLVDDNNVDIYEDYFIHNIMERTEKYQKTSLHINLLIDQENHTRKVQSLDTQIEKRYEMFESILIKKSHYIDEIQNSVLIEKNAKDWCFINLENKERTFYTIEHSVLTRNITKDPLNSFYQLVFPNHILTRYYIDKFIKNERVYNYFTDICVYNSEIDSPFSVLRSMMIDNGVSEENVNGLLLSKTYNNSFISKIINMDEKRVSGCIKRTYQEQKTKQSQILTELQKIHNI